MRLINSMSLLTISGLLAIGTACSTTPEQSDKDTADTDTDTDADTDSDTDADTDSDTDSDTDTDTGWAAGLDTAIIVIGWRGVASVDPGNSYEGTETLWMQDWNTINDTGSNVDICGWTWDVADNGSAPTLGCTDPDGNSCDFEFYIEGTNGAIDPGTDCTVLGTIDTTMDAFGYGYIDDYQYQGASYGNRLFFYDSTGMTWVPAGILGSYIFQSSSWDDGSGDFEYSFWQGAYYIDSSLLP